MRSPYSLLPEWSPQRALLLTWPHQGTDWKPLLNAIRQTYTQIMDHVLNHQDVILIIPPEEEISLSFPGKPFTLHTVKLSTNDTWIRDYGPITLGEGKNFLMLDFVFNGWGGKFEAALDNKVNQSLHQKGFLPPLETHLYVLEGGSLETDGQGHLLTTTLCQLSPHRNPGYSPLEVEEFLMASLGVGRVFLLENGHLEGDDTDGHIDTLVRFVPEGDLLYVGPPESLDSHFSTFKALEDEIQDIARSLGKKATALPFPRPLYAEDGHRLPATYANFLVINGAVLVPTYGQEPQDSQAMETIAQAFPGYTLYPVDSQVLIQQHGSIHCASMNLYHPIKGENNG